MGVRLLQVVGAAARAHTHPGRRAARSRAERARSLTLALVRWGVQEELSLLGHEQQLAKAARIRRQIKAGVAHGTQIMPVTAPPPPSWSRGGHSWIYDQQYGDMVRPTDSVWCDCNTLAECKEKCGKAEEVAAPPPPCPCCAQHRASRRGIPARGLGPMSLPPHAPARHSPSRSLKRRPSPSPSPSPHRRPHLSRRRHRRRQRQQRSRRRSQRRRRRRRRRQRRRSRQRRRRQRRRRQRSPPKRLQQRRPMTAQAAAARDTSSQRPTRATPPSFRPVAGGSRMAASRHFRFLSRPHARPRASKITLARAGCARAQRVDQSRPDRVVSRLRRRRALRDRQCTGGRMRRGKRRLPTRA